MVAMGDLFVVNDTLDAILLGAFFFGLIFSAISLILGAVDLPGVHVGHGHGHAPIHGHAPGHGHAAHTGHDNDISILNISTILAFATWFGGCAYLLRNALSLPALVGVAGGLVGGAFGAVAVFRLLLMIKRQETYLSASTERLAGSIARVTSPIREGGTGEIVYELNGVRQVSAARTSGGKALPRGAEVIVIRREHGIALVDTTAALDLDGDWERRFQIANGADEAHGPPGQREMLEDRSRR